MRFRMQTGQSTHEPVAGKRWRIVLFVGLCLTSGCLTEPSSRSLETAYPGFSPADHSVKERPRGVMARSVADPGVEPAGLFTQQARGSPDRSAWSSASRRGCGRPRS